MRIGDFAKLCKTQISVLRHYDKIGLIKPDYTDLFTGYRYYDSKQAKDFEQITKFKKLGFTLKDIKKIITLYDKHSKDVEKIFEGKIKDLELLILQIKQEKSNLLNLNRESINMINMNDFNNVKDFKEAIDKIEFENDPEAVGKWEIIGEYPTKESFLTKSESKDNNYGKRFKEIYFLPNGQRYWIYGWNKGYIINRNGDYTAVNPYKIEEINGEKYMFVDWKSYDYIKHGGQTTVLVLKQSDNKNYTLDEISRKDDINKPFVDDKKILGKWKAVARVESKDEYFNPDTEKKFFFKHTEFKENGWCENIYGEENRKFTTPGLTWTKGYILARAGKDDTENTAEKYEIKTIDGKEYLFIEWKSGDYTWGGLDPTYYVFVRE
ncbi:MAG: MerR family transcriptional regulator [Oscillospiraceae bacterium]|nr:MerR family transcriptional regulator [Oscillospiraceae bacterium]